MLSQQMGLDRPQTFMNYKRVKRFFIILVLCGFVVSHSGCSLASRLKQPVEDFRNATALVSASAKLGYETVRNSSLDEVLRKAQCAPKRADVECKPSRIDIEALNARRVYTANGMRARLDALESLKKYVDLLAELVDSDKPEKVTEAANALGNSIDKLTAQIVDLGEPSGSGASEDDPTETAQEKASRERFKATVGIFSKAVSVILSAAGNRKRDNALKRAVVDADPAVSEIMSGLTADFRIFWANETRDANTEMIKAFQAFNVETQALKDAKGTRPDTNELNALRGNVISAVNARDTLLATNPTEAVENMAKAHKELVRCATEPTKENFRASLEAVQLYLSAATRLGSAIVKLHRIKPEEAAK